MKDIVNAQDFRKKFPKAEITILSPHGFCGSTTKIYSAVIEGKYYNSAECTVIYNDSDNSILREIMKRDGRGRFSSATKHETKKDTIAF